MSIFDITTANGALATLKRVYQEGEPMSQLPSETYYLKSRKRTRRVFGAGLYDTIQTSRDMSFGIRNSAGSDNEDLPETSAPTFQNPNWDTARGYLRLVMTGKAADRALSGDSKQGFLRNINWRVQDITTSWMRDLEFRCLNTSTATGNKKGCRGVLNNSAYTAGSAVTFTLDVTANATARRYKLFQGIAEGQIIDVYSKTSWTKAARIVVASVDPIAGTFVGTLDNDLAATSDEWYLFNQGDFDKDINGSGDIIDDGTYTSTLGGVSTAGLWEGYVLGNSGTLRDFTPAMMDEASLISIKRTGGQKTQSWMSFGMKAALMGYVQRIIQVQAPAGNKMPYKVNPAGEIEEWGPNSTIHASAFMAAHEIHIIPQEEGIYIEEQVPFGPLTLGKNGNKDVFWQRLPAKDTWEAILVHELQQRCRRRNHMVKILDLNQSTF